MTSDERLADLSGVIDPAQATRAQLYHLAPCGYISMALDSTIVSANQRFSAWTRYEPDVLEAGMRFADLLTAGGSIYFETHIAPMLLTQGEVRDVAVELVRSDGTILPVLFTGQLIRDDRNQPARLLGTVFDATARRDYERDLLGARQAAETSEQQIRDVSLTLQRSLMVGMVDAGSGFAVQARYEPAVDTLEVGGDWHDAFLLDQGRSIGLSVGDVVGKGIHAAATMGQLRSALRALAIAGNGPGAALGHLHRFATTVPGAHCATVVYAKIDLGTGAIRYATAGHLPPVLACTSGEVHLLEESTSPPLGAGPGGARREGQAHLDIGGRLVLYTDGLIERRRRGIDEGLDLLIGATRSRLDAPLDELTHEILGELLADGPPSDDVCLQVFERRPLSEA